ncbi:hypothetical protein NECID01_2041 [Nematocida sp. AWRm77]|nr:hypothetical protein NECID01_2041 [Nematocida sp. AWRm77]
MGRSTKINKTVNKPLIKKQPSCLKKAAVTGVLLALAALVLKYGVFKLLDRTEDINIDIEYIASFPTQNIWNDKIDVCTPMKAFGVDYISEENEALRYRKNYVIFQGFHKNTLVSSVFISALYYRSNDPQSLERHPVFEVYNLYVNPKYRGRRQSVMHLYKTLQYLQTVYNVTEDTLIGLHISPKDKFMEVAYALYRTIGFVRGSWCVYGPNDYRDEYDKLLDIPYMDDVIEELILTKKFPLSSEGEEQKYFCMFTSLKYFFKEAEDPFFTKNHYAQYIWQGKKIRKLLESRYQY